ncbi:MAG: S9 family peptidase [Anaerolineae bacterium]|nr:S9 family peptidase [Anaerolineae bacterium]
MLPLKQLLCTPGVDPDYGFDLSPDGTKVAFAWNPTGRWEIYEAPIDGTVAPRQISNGPGAKFAPRYSPNGTRLAYAADFDGGENFHLFIFNLTQKRQADLTPNIGCALLPHFAWSPDGARIALLADRPGHFSVYTLPADGGDMQLVLDAGRPAWDVRWSPNGRWLAVEVDWRGQDHTIFLVSMVDGTTTQLVEDGVLLNAMHPAWSPDSQRLAFCADPHGWYDLGFYHLAGGVVEWASGGSGDDISPAWSAAGGLAYLHRHGALTRLAVRQPGEKIVYHQLGEGVHARPTFTPDGRQIVLTFNSPRWPNDLWRFTLADNRFCPLTRSWPATLPGESFIIPEEIYYPGLDGARIPALLYRPENSNAFSPAVVVIHGGPNWHVSVMWFPLMAHLAGRGWVVLAPNYRGSTGYGRAWQTANRFDLGGIDTQDCAAAALYLAREGLADPARIAVTGRSHGGYLTMTCLTQFPELWAAGSAVAPFLNWFTAHQNSRPDLQYWDLENMGDPRENYERWHQHSPFFFLEQIKAPVQLICGEHDPRCPPSEAVAAAQKLQALGRKVELLCYPDEGHVFLKLENLLDSELRRVSFLAAALENP